MSDIYLNFFTFYYASKQSTRFIKIDLMDSETVHATHNIISMIFKQVCLIPLPRSLPLSLSLSLYIYIYIFIYLCIYACIYIYIYILGAMGKLSSKLHKNENNTGVSLFQIYLPIIHENILKHFRLDWFKKVAISFNHGFLTTSNLLQAFPLVFLIK